jgi:hypothetical protein
MSHWEFSAPIPVLLLALALWVGAGWLCFQNWRRRGTARGMALLEGLRFLILTLIGFTLFKPEFVKEIIETEPPEVAVLFDASASMNTRDVQVDERGIWQRNQWVQLQRTNQFWKPWQKTAKVLLDDFSAPPTEGTNAAAAQKEEGTDLNAALDSTLQRYRRLKAVFLLTDGDWNLGISPVSAATRYRSRNVPIYSIGVGSETHLPDLVLQQVSAPAYGLLGEQVSIPFKIQSHLSREIRTAVTLTSVDGEETRKEIVIPAYGLAQDTLIWSPRELGDRTLKLGFPVVEGETLEDNNDQQFRISVRAEKLKVLVVESLPRLEYRYLRNALFRDPGVEVNTLLLHPGMPVGDGTNYIKSFPESKELLSKYDVVFLGDVGVGDNELTTNQLGLLRGLVEQQGSGLVFLPGSRGRQLTLAKSPVGDLLPIIYDDGKPNGTGLPTESTLKLTLAGRRHFLTMLANDELQNEEVWKGLPGFFWCAGVLKSRPGSEVLGVHSSLRNQSGSLPLLVTRPFGSGETLFMGTDAAWRWRRGVEDRYHYRFWGQVVRWMSHKRHLAAGQGVRLVYNPENPNVGDSIYLNATVFDASGFPLEKGVVNAIIVGPSGQTERIELAQVPGGWGVYKGSFIAREGGKFKITIASEKAARNLETEIMVARVQREKLGQPVNASILREIADLTGGKTGTIKEMAEMAAQINALPEIKPKPLRIKLWANPWWAGGIVVLLGIYWTGRKIVGMI